MFGCELYAPAAICTLSERYEVEPDAKEWITLKNDVFGIELYAPAAICELSPRYDVEPEANE